DLACQRPPLRLAREDVECGVDWASRDELDQAETKCGNKLSFGDHGRILIAVRAMRAEADDVLQKSLIVRRGARVIEIVLQAEAAEFTSIEFEHRAAASRRNSAAVDRAIGESAGLRGRTELVVAKPDAPARHELVDRLRVKPGLRRRVVEPIKE